MDICSWFLQYPFWSFFIFAIFLRHMYSSIQGILVQIANQDSEDYMSWKMYLFCTPMKDLEETKDAAGEKILPVLIFYSYSVLNMLFVCIFIATMSDKESDAHKKVCQLCWLVIFFYRRYSRTKNIFEKLVGWTLIKSHQFAHVHFFSLPYLTPPKSLFFQHWCVGEILSDLSTHTPLLTEKRPHASSPSRENTILVQISAQFADCGWCVQLAFIRGGIPTKYIEVYR
jgi:hypothetical protein